VPFTIAGSSCPTCAATSPPTLRGRAQRPGARADRGRSHRRRLPPEGARDPPLAGAARLRDRREAPVPDKTESTDGAARRQGSSLKLHPLGDPARAAVGGSCGPLGLPRSCTARRAHEYGVQQHGSLKTGVGDEVFGPASTSWAPRTCTPSPRAARARATYEHPRRTQG